MKMLKTSLFWFVAHLSPNAEKHNSNPDFLKKASRAATVSQSNHHRADASLGFFSPCRPGLGRTVQRQQGTAPRAAADLLLLPKHLAKSGPQDIILKPFLKKENNKPLMLKKRKARCKPGKIFFFFKNDYLNPHH